MKKICWLLIFTVQIAAAQNPDKADKKIVKSLKKHISFLADDKLEGRRTGTAGEQKAYAYISRQFEKNGLLPKGDGGSYIQAFEVNEGKQINSSTTFAVNGTALDIEKDFFPFVFSANAFVETNQYKTWDLKTLLEENKNNPHFDLKEAIKTEVEKSTTSAAIIIYNTSAIADELKFEPKGKTFEAKVPVIYISKETKQKYFTPNDAAQTIKLVVTIGDKKRTGHNVIGYVDNGASNTVILGAHYDHLGYGEDHNSLYVGTAPMIHNGADDNASGSAALMELSKLLKKSDYKKNNYLFIAFSGEELGLYGSKYFTEHPTVDIAKATYMINMDMVGRLNDSTHGLTIGGYGTSPAWGDAVKEKNEFFKIKFDSSGTGPSDHTSFYRKDIPVLFFFTGVHSDYHKPSDDADKINYTGELQIVKYIYSLVGSLNEKDKLVFTKTKENATASKSSFKVSLGVMPDYTFSEGGVRIDGVSEGKLAQKIGLKAGDILLELGYHKFSDVQSYMQVLGKFNKGDATKLKVKRGAEILEFDIVF